jgi:hypothetical protein
MRVQSSFDSLIDLARHHKQTFGRQVNAEIYRPTENQILAVVRMHDDYHDMRLAMLIGAKSLTIEGIDARMDRIPYPICEQAIASLESIKGLYIFKRGILKEIKTLIPRAYGCTHLGELIEAGLRSLFAEIEPSMLQEYKEQISSLSLEEKRHLFMRHETLQNTCVAFSTDNQDPNIASSAGKALEVLLKK